MIKNKTLLFVYDAEYETCPRPKRLIRDLEKNNRIDILCRTLGEVKPARQSFPLTKRLLSPFLTDLQKFCYRTGWLSMAWKIEASMYRFSLPSLEEYDLIFVHDIHLLPFFASVLDRVVFDAREYYPMQYSAIPGWQQTKGALFSYLCETYLSKCRLRMTVSKSIVELYQNWLSCPFVLVRSCPDFELPTVSPHVDVTKPLRIIHHGGAMKNRNLENLIQLAKLVGEDFHFYLMLVPTQPDYLASLKDLAKGLNNVHFIAPVKFEQILQTVSQYDAGIHLMDDHGDQHPYALPNKFFEYVAAGLMLIVSGSREMCELAEQDELGLGYRGKLDIDKVVKDMLTLDQKQIEVFRTNSQTARQHFRFEKEAQRLYNQLD